MRALSGSQFDNTGAYSKYIHLSKDGQRIWRRRDKSRVIQWRRCQHERVPAGLPAVQGELLEVPQLAYGHPEEGEEVLVKDCAVSK